MQIKLYNVFTGKKEIFKPIKDKTVGIYTCGPTVYDSAHIGNLRTYIFEDVLKRVLVYNGYKVKHVMNITDIEDKIIKKMKDKNKTLEEITGPFIKIFFGDLAKLNIKKADVYPKATENIKKIIQLISVILRSGFAYKGDDGSIYFDISKFKNYGRLSRIKKLKSGARVNSDEYGKKEASDFALWKAAKQNEPSWNAPFGRGRPGWHIECSAMSMKYLGENFDIHCGAVDLIFPHHENEIAQAEAATGKKFVNYWIEGEHLLVNGSKMSKSLGNFYTLADIEKAGFDPLNFRYLTFASHYRKSLNFTWKSLEAAQISLKNLRRIVSGILPRSHLGNSKVRPWKLEEKFIKAVNDDLNMPKALAVLWEAARHNGLSGGEKTRLILMFDEILGLNLKDAEKTSFPEEIKQLFEKRNVLREEKKWQEADKIREELEKNGWMVKDNIKGSVLEKIK